MRPTPPSAPASARRRAGAVVAFLPALLVTLAGLLPGLMPAPREAPGARAPVPVAPWVDKDDDSTSADSPFRPGRPAPSGRYSVGPIAAKPGPAVVSGGRFRPAPEPVSSTAATRGAAVAGVAKPAASYESALKSLHFFIDTPSPKVDLLLKQVGYEHAGIPERVWQELPAERKLETAFRSAKAAGSEKAFLAMLSRNLAQEYDGARRDPALKPFLELATDGPDAKPKYARLDAAGAAAGGAVPAECKKCLAAVSQFCEPGGLSPRVLLEHHFRLPPAAAYEILVTSRTVSEAVTRGFEASAPAVRARAIHDVVVYLDANFENARACAAFEPWRGPTPPAAPEVAAAAPKAKPAVVFADAGLLARPGYGLTPSPLDAFTKPRPIAVEPFKFSPEVQKMYPELFKNGAEPFKYNPELHKPYSELFKHNPELFKTNPELYKFNAEQFKSSYQSSYRPSETYHSPGGGGGSGVGGAGKGIGVLAPLFEVIGEVIAAICAAVMWVARKVRLVVVFPFAVAGRVIARVRGKTPAPPAPAPAPVVPAFNVVLLNDETHTFDYVIAMLQDLFGYTAERAESLAARVDLFGRAVVCTTESQAYAEMKCAQIAARGPDTTMPESTGPCGAIVEPAT